MLQQERYSLKAALPAVAEEAREGGKHHVVPSMACRLTGHCKNGWECKDKHLKQAKWHAHPGLPSPQSQKKREKAACTTSCPAWQVAAHTLQQPLLSCRPHV